MTAIERIVESVSKAVESALGVSLLDIIVQISATIILIVIIRAFFWKKILAYLDGRKEAMDKELQQAKDKHQIAEDLKEKTQEEYNELRAKSQGILDQAKLESDRERSQIVEKAKSEAAHILTSAEQKIEIDKEHARQELREEIVELASMMAGKIIDKEIDPEKYQELSIQEFEKSDKS